MDPVPRAQVGVPTCTSNVDLIRSVVSCKGVEVAAVIHARFFLWVNWGMTYRLRCQLLQPSSPIWLHLAPDEMRVCNAAEPRTCCRRSVEAIGILFHSNVIRELWSKNNEGQSHKARVDGL
jgi:hypothetical protein